MSELIATILIPTAGDRADLVELCLAAMRRQTLPKFEVFIMGDGVAEPSRLRYLALCAADERIRFFDHPKHERRGEPYRHEALKEARGRIVAYACDRDLWLPHHLATLDDALQTYDFVNTLEFVVTEDKGVMTPRRVNLAKPDHRLGMQSRQRRFDPHDAPGLSCCGHTLEAYRRLPEGWATSPPAHVTDAHMWMKFTRNPDMKTATIAKPTLLYFQRGGHPGWPTAKRFTELKPWFERMSTEPDFYERLLEEVVAYLYFDRSDKMDAFWWQWPRRFKRFRGNLAQLLGRLMKDGPWREISRRFRK